MKDQEIDNYLKRLTASGQIEHHKFGHFPFLAWGVTLSLAAIALSIVWLI